jgi:hypothetical protein
MFDIFKKEIKPGYRVRLFLTTAKEPEGTVLEIGDNYVLLQAEDNAKQRYFDKIIGGWDIVGHSGEKTTHSSEFDKETVIRELETILKNTPPQILRQQIYSNAKIFKDDGKKCLARNSKYSEIYISKKKNTSPVSLLLVPVSCKHNLIRARWQLAPLKTIGTQPFSAAKIP